MYAYAAGSPGTFAGPGYGLSPDAEGGVVRPGKRWQNVRKQFTLPPGYMGGGMGTYLQMGHKLSYAPRFNGLGAFDQAKYNAAIASGATPAQAGAIASAEASGTDWSGAVNAAITGVMGIFQISQASRLATQQRHQAEREAAERLRIAQTQALYIQSQSIVPGQGNSVLMQTGARAGGGGIGSTMMLVGGVALAGGVAWMLMRKKR